MARVAIQDSEQYPVFSIHPVDPEILLENPGAGVEVSDEFLAEYKSAEEAWNNVQIKLGEISGRYR
jgi:hypothetical protein